MSPSPGRRGAVECLPVPTAPQLAWQEAELGVVFHFDLHLFDGRRYRQPENRRLMFSSLGIFNPTQLNTDQWIRAAAEAGARFAILTSSHENGFRLWQSDANPCCLKAVGWRDGKGDIVGDFVGSCQRYGLLPGVYVGARWNGQLQVLDFQTTEHSPLTQAEYNRMVEAECLELATRYGDWFEVWFDGGIATPSEGGPNVLPIWEKHQPNCLFYHSNDRRDVRWGGSESGTVPYPCWGRVADSSAATDWRDRSQRETLMHGDPDGRDWCPAMSDAPLRGKGGHEWFWEPDQDDLIYPVGDLVDMYERSVGHNSTLILGATPDTRGLLPDADVQRLRELGEALRKRYGSPQAQVTDPSGPEFVLAWREPAAVDRVVLQEDIRHGERIREYFLDGRNGDGPWQALATGSCIGHKRIERLAPVVLTEVRLRTPQTVAVPLIRKMAAYSADPMIQ